MARTSTTRIAPGAYPALAEALATVFWYKPPFLAYVRGHLRDHPEILSAVDTSQTKRKMAYEITSWLQDGEDEYRDCTLELMLAVAEMDQFTDLQRHEDRDYLLEQARNAVAGLRHYTENFREVREERERRARAQIALAAENEARRAHSTGLAELKQRFMELQSHPDAQQRGRDLEVLLTDLFHLFDLQPRRPFVAPSEQIDGSFVLGDDNFLLESKWLKGGVSRAELDAFASKIERKAKTAFGLFISVNGFSPDSLAAHDGKGLAFIAMDGMDLFYVLDERIALDELLRRKLRRATETGTCLFRVSEIVM